jgi:predicted HicB family RNase H-like nuclease
MSKKITDDPRLEKLRELSYKLADGFEFVSEKTQTKHDWYRLTIHVREKITNKRYRITVAEEHLFL